MNELTKTDLTSEQLDLIKSTVAKGATSDELRLFLYRCKNMGLDPLKPGQIYFVKYGSSPGTMVVGLDGFRSQAAKTGKHTGTQRGVIRDEKGNCIGAWCEVYRSDWAAPAREEVNRSEYDTGKAMWLKMPETMIKKVAEVAALRMAFPDQLGGLYSPEEMEQAAPQPIPIKNVAPKKKSLPEPVEHIEPEPNTEPAPDLAPGQGLEKKSIGLTQNQAYLLEKSILRSTVPKDKIRDYIKSRYGIDDPLQMTTLEFTGFLSDLTNGKVK